MQPFSLRNDAPQASDVPGGDDLTSKILAFCGSAAVGFAAVVNMVIAGVALISGNLIGAVGDASSKIENGADLAASAHSAALTAKILAIGFALLAGLGFIAGAFIRRRKRHLFVPIATGTMITGWVGFAAWSAHFTALDAILIGCTLFATFVWYRSPKTLPPQASYGSSW